MRHSVGPSPAAPKWCATRTTGTRRSGPTRGTRKTCASTPTTSSPRGSAKARTRGCHSFNDRLTSRIRLTVRGTSNGSGTTSPCCGSRQVDPNPILWLVYIETGEGRAKSCPLSPGKAPRRGAAEAARLPTLARWERPSTLVLKVPSLAPGREPTTEPGAMASRS